MARRAIEERSSFANTPGLNDPRKALTDVFSSMFGFGSDHKIAVTSRTASGYPPIAQAVDLIAADVAKIPLNVYRSGADTDRVKDPNHYVSRLVNAAGDPNDEDTSIDFWYDVMHDALLTGRGKGLAWIERRGALPVGIYRLVAADWQPLRIKGRLFWQNYANYPITLPDADVIVIRSRRIDGLLPDDPIRMYADTLRVGVSTQRFASNFFENGAHVGGILAVPPGSSETATRNVETAVRSKEDPNNWFKTLVLRDGFKFQPTTVDPKQANLSEIDEGTARHVARIYNLPPSKLGLTDSVSYNSLEHANRHYHDSTLTPWLRRIAAQVRKKMVLPSEQRSGQVTIEHHIDALQWADSAGRATIATQGIQSGWLEVDEVRHWHNLPARKTKPKPEGTENADD